MRVAVATEDGVHVAGHFGRIREYQIYEIESKEQLIWKQENIVIHEEDIPKPDANGNGGGCMGHNEKALEYIATKLEGCTYVVLEKIGPKPSKILMRYGIHPLETNIEINEALRKLVDYTRKKGE
jgi:predicted Fe-Mo cluster-binding NifX family protein